MPECLPTASGFLENLETETVERSPPACEVEERVYINNIYGICIIVLS